MLVNKIICILESLIKIKDEALARLDRAGGDLRINVKSKSSNLTRDERIKNAMAGVTHEDPAQRWSVSFFLKEMAEPDSDPVFQIIDLGEYLLK